MVSVNKQIQWISDAEGNELTVQHVRSQTHCCEARSDTAFIARVSAMGYASYFMKFKENPAEEKDCGELFIDDTSMENENFRIEFEAHTGYVRSIYDKINGRELLDGYGAVPRVIDEYEHDTWSHALNFFDKHTADFSDGELKIIERGYCNLLRTSMDIL